MIKQYQLIAIIQFIKLRYIIKYCIWKTYDNFINNMIMCMINNRIILLEINKRVNK